MIKRLLKSVICCSLLSVALCIQGSCSGFDTKRAEGERVVKKIEEFKATQKRLPRSLGEIGLRETEEGPIYYRQLSEVRYELWYGSSLGESVTYDSERGSWQ